MVFRISIPKLWFESIISRRESSIKLWMLVMPVSTNHIIGISIKVNREIDKQLSGFPTHNIISGFILPKIVVISRLLKIGSNITLLKRMMSIPAIVSKRGKSFSTFDITVIFHPLSVIPFAISNTCRQGWRLTVALLKPKQIIVTFKKTSSPKNLFNN